jgi:diguanylate cyclase (GGDEF)-like protein/PAS domain S-box-containing protein
LPSNDGHEVRKTTRIVQLLAGIQIALGAAAVVARLWPAGLAGAFGLGEMSLDSAVCFILLGCALLPGVPAPERGWVRHAGTVCAALALGLALANILRIASGWPLTISPAVLSGGGSRAPGTMRLPAALCLALSGLSASTLYLRRRDRLAASALIFAALTFGIGVLALSGYALNLEPLYSSYPLSRMSLPSALGVLLAGAALCLCWSDPLQTHEEEHQIVAVGTIALVVVAVLSALTGLWVLRTQGTETLNRSLQTMLRARAGQLALALEQRDARVTAAGSQPSLLRAARRLADHPDNNARQALLRELAGIRQFGFDGVELRSAAGLTLAAGAALPDSDPELTVRSAQPGHASLAWRNGRLVIRNRIALRDAAGGVGELVLEHATPVLQAMLLSATELGGDGVVMLCGDGDGGGAPLCLPYAGQPAPLRLPGPNDEVRLIGLALQGASGTGQIVAAGGGAQMAAYGPAGGTGLAFLLRLNTGELYAPIRHGLFLGLLLVALLVVAAAAWLRRRVRALARRLSFTESRYKTVVESLNEGLMMQDASTRVVASNPAALRILGLAPEVLAGRQPLPEGYRTIHEDGSDWPAHEHPGAQTLRSGVAQLGRLMGLVRPDGSLRWISINTAPGPGAEPGDRHGAIVSFTDVTERREAEYLRRAILEAAPLSIIATDAGGTVTAVNPAAERMLWYKSGELVGGPCTRIHEQQELAQRGRELSAELGRTIEADFEVLVHKSRFGIAEESEWSYVRKNGSRFPVNLAVTALRDERGEISGFLSIAYDITERKRRDEYTRHIAHHDFLTGLPNRVLLQDRMRSAIQRARRDGARVAVMMLDLDHFKRVNDSLGHHVGDQLLQTVASRILGCVRGSDTVARMGGDEFAILLCDVHGDAGVERVAQEIIEQVAAPIEVGGHELFVTPSIGISRYPDDGQDLQALLMNADSAMYQAKTEGRHAYRLFSRDMEIAARKKLDLEGAMRQALKNGEFRMHYQPQVCLRSGEVTGMEALLRWHNPQRGWLSPGDFIPVAEESGLIVEIGAWVLATACREARLLQQRTGRPLRVAVNLSPRQFLQADLPQSIQRIVAESGLQPGDLELEITEGLLMAHTPQMVERLKALRALGVSIAVDDFGVGFSSMAYITKFPITTLKIDRVFVSQLPGSAGDAAVAQAIIALGHSLDINVVAEGIETREQLDYLRAHHCDSAQGRWLGMGVPLEQFSAQGFDFGQPALRQVRA